MWALTVLNCPSLLSSASCMVIAHLSDGFIVPCTLSLVFLHVCLLPSLPRTNDQKTRTTAWRLYACVQHVDGGQPVLCLHHLFQFKIMA